MLNNRQAPGRNFHKHFSLAPARSRTGGGYLAFYHARARGVTPDLTAARACCAISSAVRLAPSTAWSSPSASSSA